MLPALLHLPSVSTTPACSSYQSDYTFDWANCVFGPATGSVVRRRCWRRPPTSRPRSRSDRHDSGAAQRPVAAHGGLPPGRSAVRFGRYPQSSPPVAARVRLVELIRLWRTKRSGGVSAKQSTGLTYCSAVAAPGKWNSGTALFPRTEVPPRDIALWVEMH